MILNWLLRRISSALVYTTINNSPVISRGSFIKFELIINFEYLFTYLFILFYFIFFCSHWYDQNLIACKISVSLSVCFFFFFFFDRISELKLATLIQRYDKKSFHFKNERLIEILRAVKARMILCACAGWSEYAHFAHVWRHFSLEEASTWNQLETLQSDKPNAH